MYLIAQQQHVGYGQQGTGPVLVLQHDWNFAAEKGDQLQAIGLSHRSGVCSCCATAVAAVAGHASHQPLCD